MIEFEIGIAIDKGIHLVKVIINEYGYHNERRLNLGVIQELHGDVTQW